MAYVASFVKQIQQPGYFFGNLIQLTRVVNSVSWPSFAIFWCKKHQLHISNKRESYIPKLIWQFNIYTKLKAIMVLQPKQEVNLKAHSTVTKWTHELLCSQMTKAWINLIIYDSVFYWMNLLQMTSIEELCKV